MNLQIFSDMLCSVGIIGGADGPTKIIITSSSLGDYILIGVLAAIFIGLIFLYFYIKKKRK